MKWYEQKYVNRRDWVLDHLELLGLTSQETVLVLLIDFMMEHSLSISMESLRQKCGMDEDEMNGVIDVLCAKKYLNIFASASGVRFDLSGLYETDTEKDARIMDSPLYDVFETEFGRPLSEAEMSTVSEWNRTTDRKIIIYALREASAYGKMSIAYIGKILSEWKTKGVTAEAIEEGAH